jgi:hypothetical protein
MHHLVYIIVFISKLLYLFIQTLESIVMKNKGTKKNSTPLDKCCLRYPAPKFHTRNWVLEAKVAPAFIQLLPVLPKPNAHCWHPNELLE